MRIAVVDDQEMWCNRVDELVREYYGQDSQQIDHYECGEDFYNQGEYDIVFMDIELKQMDGFEAVRLYKENHEDAIIIFLTTHAEMSRQGYLVNAFRYILKSNIEIEIEEALKAIDILNSKKQLVQFHVINMGMMCIKADDVLFIETDNRNVIIHTKEQDFISNRKMDDFEDELVEIGFFRCHKSYLINLQHVHKFDRLNVYFKNGKKALVSTRKYVKLKERYFEQKFLIANS